MPRSLSYAQLLFLEEQRAALLLGRFWPVIKVLALAYVIFSIVLIVRSYRSMPRSAFVAIAFLIGLACLATLVVLYCNAVTIVEAANVQIRLAIASRITFFSRTVPIGQIVSVGLTDMSPDRKVLTIMPGSLYFMVRKKCVRLSACAWVCPNTARS